MLVAIDLLMNDMGLVASQPGSTRIFSTLVSPSLTMAASHLSPALMAELKATADAMSAPCKGFLAADESAGPWLRAGHVEAKKIEDTAENRAAYRAMCFTTPGLSQYVSGVILHWETLFQKDSNGKQLVDMIKEAGLIPGIKMDKVAILFEPLALTLTRAPTLAYLCP